MLSNRDLSEQLAHLASAAGQLSGAVSKRDLPAAVLAEAFVAGNKLLTQLGKLGLRLDGPGGKKGGGRHG